MLVPRPGLASASDSGDPASQKRIDGILAEHGADGFAGHFLRSADLAWAADLIGEFPGAARSTAPQPPAPGE